MAISPLYGNQYSKKFNATFYVKPYTTAFSKPATAAAALTAFDRTAGVNTFTCDAVVDGDYIVVSSATNSYCVWIDADGAGTGKPTAPSGCTAYLSVTVATGDLSTVDTVGAAIATAINTTQDLTATYTAATDTLVVTAVQGGTEAVAASIANVGDGGATDNWAVTNTTPGAGDWMKIGGVSEDYTVEPSPNEIRDTVGNKIVTYEALDINFSFMNLDQRNIDILKDYNRTQVSIAIVDKTNTSYPKIYCVNDLTFNVSLNPSGDTANAPIMLSKRVEDTLSGTYFWTYNTDLV